METLCVEAKPKKRINRNVLSVASIVALIGALAGFYKVAVADAKGKAEEVERDLKEHIRDGKEESREVRQDIQAIYNFLLTHERQERLEKKR